MIDERVSRHDGGDARGDIDEADLAGRRLTDTDILGFCFLLIAGGNETTEKLIANTVHQLGRHPEQRAAIIADPSRIPAAVEESLRFRSPTQYMVRKTTREVAIHGRNVRVAHYEQPVFAWS